MSSQLHDPLMLFGYTWAYNYLGIVDFQCYLGKKLASLVQVLDFHAASPDIFMPLCQP